MTDSYQNEWGVCPSLAEQRAASQEVFDILIYGLTIRDLLEPIASKTGFN